MPASMHSDQEKEAIKMLVIEIGASNAARRLGIPLDRIKNWAHRYKWMEGLPGRTKTKVSPSQALIDEYKELDGDSRINLARGFNKATKRIAEMSGEEIFDNAEKAKSVVQSVAQVHAWQSDRPMNKISLSITGANVKIEEEAIEAEWTDAPMEELEG